MTSPCSNSSKRMNLIFELLLPEKPGVGGREEEHSNDISQEYQGKAGEEICVISKQNVPHRVDAKPEEFVNHKKKIGHPVNRLTVQCG